MKTLTPETANTKSEISALIYAHVGNDFRSFTKLIEDMLDKYAYIQEESFNNDMTKLSQQAKDNISLKLNNDIEDCKFELRQNKIKINELSDRQKVLKKQIFELNKLINYLK